MLGVGLRWGWRSSLLTGHEDSVADVLNDAPGGFGELLAGHALLAECVGELLGLEWAKGEGAKGVIRRGDGRRELGRNCVSVAWRAR